MDYEAFTDIAFNPQRSINCQAEVAAIYVSLQKQKLLDAALKSKEAFYKKLDDIDEKIVSASGFEDKQIENEAIFSKQCEDSMRDKNGR